MIGWRRDAHPRPLAIDNGATEMGSSWSRIFMKSYDICTTLFRMQVYGGLIKLGNDKPDVSGEWLEGGIFISLWPMHWSPNFLDKHKTSSFFLVNSFTTLGVVSGISHAHQARSSFSQSEKFHSTYDTWLRAGRNFRLHPTITVGALSPYYMIFNC